MTELLPCPFCGGEAEKLTSIDGFTSIGCLNCNPFYGVMIQATTEAEAIAAWNSRADYHGYEQAAIEAWESIKAWNSRAERMCEMRADGAHCMNGVEFYECRSCGEYACIPTMMGKSEPPNYCPNCGRKVVE